ncbi:MAG: hypothetical protein Q7S65_00005, partial [Nanoarchaeota archaeon]|nr:hypothetical protein [Nanoarchaeota archaeon]
MGKEDEYLDEDETDSDGPFSEKEVGQLRDNDSLSDEWFMTGYNRSMDRSYQLVENNQRSIFSEQHY